MRKRAANEVGGGGCGTRQRLTRETGEAVLCRSYTHREVTEWLSSVLTMTLGIMGENTDNSEVESMYPEVAV